MSKETTGKGMLGMINQLHFDSVREELVIIGRIDNRIFLKINEFTPHQWYECINIGILRVDRFELHQELDRAYDKYYAPKYRNGE